MAQQIEYQFTVWQGNDLVAHGACADEKTARQEAGHYAMQYGHDGPVTVDFFIAASAGERK